MVEVLAKADTGIEADVVRHHTPIHQRLSLPGQKLKHFSRGIVIGWGRLHGLWLALHVHHANSEVEVQRRRHRRGSPVNPVTSLMMPAPATAAASMTLGLRVSIETRIPSCSALR